MEERTAQSGACVSHILIVFCLFIAAAYFPGHENDMIIIIMMIQIRRTLKLDSKTDRVKERDVAQK
jgi:hypothetical protein